MRDIRNLAGTIMQRDKQLVEFVIEDYVVKHCEVLCDVKECPIEFWKKPPAEALLLCLKDRATPETRIGLADDLKAVDIPYYDLEMIIRYNHGYSICDRRWIQFAGENYSFQQIQDRARRKSRELCSRDGK